jgi:mannose-6-phosphate isomerase
MIFRPQPTLISPPWGGTALSARYGKGRPGETIGESWELWEHSLLLDGRKVSEVCRFPLLIKLLDVQGVLSVQVHPDEKQALLLEGRPEGKAESWYIMEAAPGARVAWGLNKSLSEAQLRADALSGAIEADLRWLNVGPGQVVDLPPGTIHTLSGGVLLYEVQQPSELTYRLYDWGRPRQLHLDKALSVARREPLSEQGLRQGRTGIIIDTPHFQVELRELSGSVVWNAWGWEAWTIISGSLRVHTEEVLLGTTVLVEPGMYVLYGNAKVLVAMAPGPVGR